MNYGWRFVTLHRRQESRPSPRKRNAKKAKWLSEEALRIAVKRREVKSKGEKERYTHLSAEFQRIARRDKKALLWDQCKETEENNRMGKTKDLFKKIRDSKGILHAKIDSIQDISCMDLIKAADTKKRWQEYTEERYKKDLHDPDNHDGVITHLEPDIVECEVKWTLGSIAMNKASGGDGIPVELFQSLKDDAMKVLHSICQQIWKTQQWPQNWKISVFIAILKSLMMKVKEESENIGLKLNIQKTKIMASGPITSGKIDGKTVETVADFIFLGSKITADGDCSHEIKRLVKE